MNLPKSEFESMSKAVEAFTLENKSNGSHEILFIDKDTQASLGSCSVCIECFKDKGATYDI